MTESEWLECTDPTPMLEFVKHEASDRKLRLFAVACCRVCWVEPPIDATKTAIETNELFADLRASEKELSQARASAHSAAWAAGYYYERIPITPGGTASILRSVDRTDVAPEHLKRLYFVAFMANPTLRLRADEMPMLRADPVLRRSSPSLLQDIFGNLFRFGSIKPTLLTPTVINLAQSAYDERSLPSGELDPERLAVLSDALEEAGCDDADILNHLRSQGPHVRGCWVVDLLIGKD